MHIRTVDVIIPTYKPSDEFSLLLQRLQEQTVLPNRVLVVNTRASGYSMESYVERFGVELFEIDAEDFDHGGTRDQMIRESEADIVLLMTQDAIPLNRFLIERLIEPFSDERVAVSYARQLPRKDCNIVERRVRRFNYPDKDLIKTSESLNTMGIKTYFCSDVCAAYRRDRYLEQGGFVHPVIFNEDMIMAASMIKAGYAVYYASKAQVIHSHNYSCREYLKRNFDLGVSQAMHPEVFQDVSSESEGGKLVIGTLKFLLRHGKILACVRLFTTSVAKYCGFLLGKNYLRLSDSCIQKLTVNPEFWKKGRE